MAFRQNEHIQKAKVTIFYDGQSKKLLPYVKVTAWDDAQGYGHTSEYYAPHQLKFGIGVKDEQILEVEVERRAEGEFPPTSTALHRFNEV